jgi:hypothetical protein
VILDSNGTALKVGMRVLDKHGDEEGTITGLSDPDGDVNEYGRPVPIGPYVVVRYDNGDIERWTATWNATGPWDDYRTDYTCDDVTVPNLAAPRPVTSRPVSVEDAIEAGYALDDPKHPTFYERMVD